MIKVKILTHTGQF